VFIDPTFVPFAEPGGTLTVTGLDASRAALVLQDANSQIFFGTSFGPGPLNIPPDNGIFNGSPRTFTTILLATGGTGLGGEAGVTAQQLFTWTGGSQFGTGTTFANGGLNISGVDEKTLARTLQNASGQTASWTGGQITFVDAGTFTNLGTFRAEHAGDLAMANGGGVGTKLFDNQGSFIKAAPQSGTVGTTTIQAPIVFNNSGAVDIQAG